MSMIKNFVHHFTQTDTGLMQYHQLWRFASMMLIGVLMVKAGWDGESIGTVELLFFLGAILTMAWVSGVKNALLAEYPKHEQKDQLLASSFVSVQVVGIGIALLFYVFQGAIIDLLCGVRSLPHTNLLVLYLAIVPISILTDVIWMLRGETKRLLPYTHVIYPLQWILMIAAAFMVGTVESVIWAWLAITLIKWLWIVIYLLKHVGCSFQWRQVSPLWYLALPLIAQFAIGYGAEFVDGIIVNHYFDRETFAVFRYGARELPITQIMVSAIMAASIPLIISQVNKGFSHIKDSTRKLMQWLYPLSMILICISPWLYSLVYSTEYLEAARVFNVYLLILISRILLPQALMIAHKKGAALLIIAILELLVNVGMSVYWVGTYGLLGIALATLVANLVHVLLMVAYNYWMLNVRPSQYIPIRSYTLYSVLLLIVFIISDYWHYGG